MADLPHVEWPEAGDQLFTIVPGDRDYTACVNFADPWIGYTEGYLRAGRVLVNSLADTNGANLDFLVYPIVFVYRQHLELRMKELIAAGSRLHDLDGTFEKVHDLTRLWPKCRAILEMTWSDAPADILSVVGEQLQQLEALDQASMAFRYPVDRQGNLSLPIELKQFNLRHFAERIERIAAMLDGASTGIGVYIDDKAEMAQYNREEGAYYAAEYAAEARAEFEAAMRSESERYQHDEPSW